MAKSWSSEAWNASEHIYSEILKLPFLNEMAQGTLPREKFLYYLSQDKLYLDDYSRVLAHIASRLPDLKQADTFLRFARDGVMMEKALHAQFVGEDSTHVKSPVCLLYTSLLRSQSLEDVAVQVAAILPCFWIYQKVGEHILNIAKMEGNPYAQWIEAYSDPSFATATREAIAIAESLAETSGEPTRRRMTEIYLQCARMEYLFWDAAYNLQSWPQNLI